MAETIAVTFNSPDDVAVTSNGYTATGNTVNFTLNFAPMPGAELMVVKNTGPGFVVGSFDNLTQGQVVPLTFGGGTYNFVADYHGGTGNDIVLSWAVTRAYAWGYDASGQLGDNSLVDRSAPTPVSDKGVLAGRTILTLAAGDGHSMALADNGSLTAWGNNASGQLGNNNSNNSTVPVPVLTAGTPLAGRRIAALAAGAAHSVALCDDGTLATWGYDNYGQLGDGAVANRYFPAAVSTTGTPLAGRTMVAVAAGAHHTLALCADGTLAAWGLNVYGQLGDGTTANRNTPVAVTTAGTPLAGRTVVTIAAGRNFSAALCSDGTLVAWGDNSSGQLGDTTTTVRSVPVAVTTVGTPLAGRTTVNLTAGGNFCLVRCTDGTLAAWGYNGYGQLGDGTTTERHAPVMVVTAGTPLAGKTVTSIAACTYHSLALCDDGTLAAWGRNNSGQLGDNSQFNRTVPGAVAPLSSGGRFSRIFSAANAFHTVALAAFPPAPEIAVFTGPGTLPVDECESGGNNLAFAPILVGNSSPAQSFTIKNTGTADLTGIILTTAGAHPGDFILSPPGVTTLAPGATTTFTVGFTPTATGLRTAEVRIASNDADENPFVIQVTGENPTPDIAVFNGASIATSDARASGIGSFSLDPVTVGGSGLTRTFTIRNTGTSDLAGMAISNAGSNPSDFTASAPVLSTLVPGATTTFTVSFTPTAAGLRSALVYISSNDADENPFVVAVSGTAFVPGGIVTASYSNGSEVPVSATSFTASGKTVNFSLHYTPVTGAELRVVTNTGTDFITGTFDGLTQGQLVELEFGGNKFPFVVNYYGGNGNDLVLTWAANKIYSWGYNGYGVLGVASTTDHAVPVPVSGFSQLSGKTVLAVAPGTYHVLALCADGTLASWGSGGCGQLGNGSLSSLTVPGSVTTAGTPLLNRTVIGIAAGENHSLALCADGTLVAWGYNNSGQLGDGTTTNRPLAVAVTTAGTPLATRTILSIAAGAFHSIALCSDGTMVSWGQNNAGQVGDNSTTQRNVPVAVATAGTPLATRTVVSIAAGGSHNLALCSDGMLVAWGQNADGQIGDNSTTPRLVPVAVTTGGTPLEGRTITDLAAGGGHSMALCSDGTLAAWGWNTQGQIGDNTTTQRRLPTSVTIAGTALAGKLPVAISAGSHHSLALCSDGALTAWGYNSSGQLGDGTTTQRLTAVSVNTSSLSPNQRFATTATGGRAFMYSMVLVAAPPAPEITVFDGTLAIPAAARQNNTGFVFANTPVGTSSAAQVFTIKNTGTAALGGLALTVTGANPVDFPLNVAGLSATLPPGASTTFSITFSPSATGARSATVKIASNADENPFTIQLGTAPTSGVLAWGRNDHGECDVPANINMNQVKAIKAGIWHNVALTEYGSVIAWGLNDHGECNVPVDLNDVKAVAAGWHHTVALKNDGTVVTWGDNSLGQSTVPAGLNNVVAIAAGVWHTVALKSDGTVIAWGYNNDGQTSVPIGLNGVTAIAAGYYHNLALKSDGTVVAWGYNNNGQTIVPVGLNGVTAISAALWHNVALKNDATVVAWGYNNRGQTDVPANLVDVTAIAAGGAHTLALKSDGTVVAWGGNEYGQTVVPTTISHVTAIAGGDFHSLALLGPAPTAEISLYDGDGLERQSNIGSYDFPGKTPGSPAVVKIFTLQNNGTATLTGLSIAKTGLNPADFTLGTLGATSLAPGATTAFTLSFAPSITGSRSATVQITSNDPDENPFIINVGGTGLNAIQNWRLFHLGSFANAGNSADNADPDLDGVPNLLEYALGLNPSLTNITDLPVASFVTGHLKLTFNRAANTTALTYAVEATDDLTGMWTEIYSASGVNIADQVTVTDPQSSSGNPRRFLRLRVTDSQAGP